MKKYTTGKQYRIDTDFENARLVDTVTVVLTPAKVQKKVLVYSPRLRANILIKKKDLKKVKE